MGKKELKKLEIGQEVWVVSSGPTINKGRIDSEVGQDGRQWVDFRNGFWLKRKPDDIYDNVHDAFKECERRQKLNEGNK